MSEVKSVEQVEVNELSESNAELAAFLGEDTSNLPVVIETIDTEIIEDHKMDAIRPDKLTEEAFNEITSSVSSFIEKVKEDATDMTLSSLVYKIGEKAANMEMTHVS